MRTASSQRTPGSSSVATRSTRWRSSSLRSARSVGEVVMEHWYRAHGLVIASAIELSLPPGSPTPGKPDLVLRCGPDRPVPSHDPSGCRLAKLSSPEGTVLYSLGRDRDRTVLRYPG